MSNLELKKINIEGQLNIITNEFPKNKIPNPFNILDIGCGGGSLMSALHLELKKIYPDTEIKVYGFEVLEHTGSRKNYLDTIINNLSNINNSIQWQNRIKIISDTEPFPFENEFFHCLISTQVIEHVKNHELFFSENYRVLANNGIGIHTYPVKECYKDNHLKLYFIHKFYDYEFIYNYIRFFSKFGIGKFKGKYKKNKINNGFSVNDYAKYQAEYVIYQLNYLRLKEALHLCKKNNLRATFTRYNLSLRLLNNKNKLLYKILHRLINGKNKPYSLYKYSNIILCFLEKLILFYQSRFGNVTLILEKKRAKRYGVFVK